MCGIFGSSGRVDYDPRRVSRLLRHRGPDDEGWVVINTQTSEVFHARGDDTVEELSHLPHVSDVMDRGDLLLLSRRLRIIDLSPKGHQPMEFEGLLLVFNGEIYNYLEVRKELEGEGYTFWGDSDTEVLLKALHRWGPDALRRLNGMWAFALYDRRERKLLLSRDRFGKKPLYYIHTGRKLVFSSEIKALLHTSLSGRSFDTDEVIRFLVYSESDMNENTLFKGIKRLLPSHYAVYNLETGDMRIERYYSLNVPERRIPFNEAKERFLHLFTESIGLRLRSDVKTGTSLSGGLDSSSIVFFASKSNHPNFSYYAFSAVHPRFPEYDEREFIEEAVRATGVKWVYTESDKGILENNLERFVYHQEEPVGTLSPFAQFMVYTLPRNYGVIVLLDGQGGDETLAGYLRYVPVYILERLRKMDVGRAIGEMLKFRRSNLNYPLTFARMVLNVLGPEFLFKLRSSQIFRKPPDYVPPPSQTRERVFDLREKLVQDIRDNISTLLRYADKNSSAFSLEVRSPYLDYRLVEFLLSLPSDYKIRGGYTKFIARKAFEGVLPPKIVWRRDKLGFPFPQEYLLDDGLFKRYTANSKVLAELGVKDGLNHILKWRVMNVALIEKVFGL